MLTVVVAVVVGLVSRDKPPWCAGGVVIGRTRMAVGGDGGKSPREMICGV